MNRLKYIIVLVLICIFYMSCNETLEDTYSDYAGNGKIRYLGKCSNIEITPGWERLELKWQNSTDQVIDKIKVKWSANDFADSLLLDRTTDSCNITGLEDASYRIDICAVDKNGVSSLVETTYGRPYTENHEVVRTFTRAITKFYKVKDNLVCFMDLWNENILNIDLSYTDLQGKKQVLPLTKEIFEGTVQEGGLTADNGFIVLRGVKTDQPITITRLGKLADCPDTIRFDPIVLDDSKVFTSDFKLAIQARYGYTDQTENQKIEFENFVNSVEELEFDNGMTTFEDILYCTNLKKIVFGKNRYLHPIYRTATSMSSLDEMERSLKALKAANELLGLEIDSYNQHYFVDEIPDFMHILPNPEVPELEYVLESEIDTVISSIPEVAGFDSGLGNLFDNDQTTWWEPLESGFLRTFELLIKLKSPQPVKGIKIAQVVFDPSMDKKSQYYLPGQVQVQVSSDQIQWKPLTFMQENTIGRSSGEITLLPMTEPREVQYVKVTITDQVNVNIYNVKLADIVLYR